MWSIPGAVLADDLYCLEYVLRLLEMEDLEEFMWLRFCGGMICTAKHNGDWAFASSISVAAIWFQDLV